MTTTGSEGIEAEAQDFMAGYAEDLLSHDPDAIAARYSRRGAYLVLPGSRALVSYDSIRSEYRAASGQGPNVFEWQDLSYDVLHDDAVAVVGTFRSESVEGGVLGSYTGLLVREDGELRIRLESESFDDLPPPECAAREEPCDLMLGREALERYTGEYHVPGEEGPGRVFERDGHLMFQPPGLPAMRMLYRGGDEFRLAEHLAVRVVFDGAGERATSYMVLRGMVLGTGNRGTDTRQDGSSVDQPPPSSAESQDSLEAVVADLDARYFDAYNRCDLEALEAFHADDLEAYHDRRGGPFGWETMRGMLARGICAVPGRLRRELVPGTLAVYPIAGGGAVQMADHLFYEKAEDGEEHLTTAAKMIVLWRHTEGGWKVSRVISYDHVPPAR